MVQKHHGMYHPYRGVEDLCMINPVHSEGSEYQYNLNLFRPGRFARLFPELPPLYINPTILQEIGKKGGIMEDKGTPDLTQNTPAGLIFFGQFIDHDITLDGSSSLTASNDPLSTENVRTPTLDLDCVYGDGPEAHPYLYDDAGRLLTGSDYDYPSSVIPNWENRDDLPRTPKGTAIIGDPRNDENRIISQIQLSFLRFHNKVVDSGKTFTKARRIVTWHYQWIVVNDFLRTICGDWVVDDILSNGRKVYRPECLGAGEPFVPIEFAAAAYRFGHTMIPQKLRVKVEGPQHVILDKESMLGKGFEPVTNLDAVVEWAALLDSGNGVFERAGAMDVKLPEALLDLSFIPPEVPVIKRSLAVRNLLRAQSFLIPSGEQIAKAMIQSGAKEIKPEMIKAVHAETKKLGFFKATPLWVYILAEGKAVGRLDKIKNGQKRFTKCEGLGPVGARFVAEVIIGLIELDSRSFIGANRNWTPLDTADKVGTDGVASLYQLLTA